MTIADAVKLPKEVREKAHEYIQKHKPQFRTFGVSQFDVENAWLEGFAFCLQGKVDVKMEDLQKELEKERNLNAEIKARFVRCNTCTEEMKSKCLMNGDVRMTKKNLNKKQKNMQEWGGLPKEKHLFGVKVLTYLASAEPREKRIADLEAQIEKMKCCGNCQKLRGRFDSKTNINILYCSDSDMKQIEVGFQMCCCKWEIKEE